MSEEDKYSVKIPIEVVNATHRNGYFALYLKYKSSGHTTKEAWEKVEADLEAHGLPGRYSTFKSFLNNTWKMRHELRRWSKFSTSNIIL